MIRDNLSKLGIRVAIQPLLPNEIAARALGSFDYEAILFGFTPTDVAPDLQASLWYSNGAKHFWRPSQEKPAFPWESTVDALISRLVTGMDPAVQESGLRPGSDHLATEMPAIPTFASDISGGMEQ